MLSQDLLQASLEIPFSVPPYMSLLARAVATLEGIALTGDPNYQMVTQAWDPSLALAPSESIVRCRLHRHLHQSEIAQWLALRPSCSIFN